MSKVRAVVPILKYNAAQSVALSLWKQIDAAEVSRVLRLVYMGHFNNNTNQRSETREWIRIKDELISKIVGLSCMVSLPTCVAQSINECVRNIFDQIESWIDYHFLMLFHHRDFEYQKLANHYSYLVWCSDASIDYKETARNLQKSNLLSEFEKFQFSCEYCLEDEINQNWTLFKYELESFDFDFYPLLRFWNCYCSGKLSEISAAEELPVCSSVFRHSLINNNWTAKEYFFDLMTSAEQVQNIIWSVLVFYLYNAQNFVIVAMLIKKLSQSQRVTVFSNFPVEVLMCYAINAENYCHMETLFDIWFEVKEMISEDEFVMFMNELTQLPLEDLYNHVIAEIWTSASDKLKIHALDQPNAGYFIERIWNSWMEYYDCDSFTMLLDAGRNVREKIKDMRVFRHHCRVLIICEDLFVFERISNLCFRKPDELALFKLNLAQTEWFNEICEYLVVSQTLESLKRLYDVLLDTNDLNDVKKAFAGREFFMDHCLGLVKDGKIKELDELLNIIFSKSDDVKQYVRDRSMRPRFQRRR